MDQKGWGTHKKLQDNLWWNNVFCIKPHHTWFLIGFLPVVLNRERCLNNCWLTAEKIPDHSYRHIRSQPLLIWGCGADVHDLFFFFFDIFCYIFFCMPPIDFFKLSRYQSVADWRNVIQVVPIRIGTNNPLVLDFWSTMYSTNAPYGLIISTFLSKI